MKKSTRALLFATACSAMTFVAGSFQDQWTITLVGDRDGIALGQATFWGWIQYRSENEEPSKLRDRENLLNCALLLCITLAVGIGVYWIGVVRIKPKNSDDYVDGPTGLTKDGN